MSYHQQLQAYIEEYRRKVHGGPVQVADIAAWLIREGRWAPSPQAALGLLARDLSEAMRTQYTTDAAGRRVRRCADSRQSAGALGGRAQDGRRDHSAGGGAAAASSRWYLLMRR